MEQQQAKSIVKGFLAGALLTSSFTAPVVIWVQTILFLVGAIVLIDCVVPFGAQPYIVSGVIAAILGVFVSTAVFLIGMSFYYLLVVVVITVLFYLFSYAGRK